MEKDKSAMKMKTWLLIQCNQSLLVFQFPSYSCSWLAGSCVFNQSRAKRRQLLIKSKCPTLAKMGNMLRCGSWDQADWVQMHNPISCHQWSLIVSIIHSRCLNTAKTKKAKHWRQSGLMHTHFYVHAGLEQHFLFSPLLIHSPSDLLPLASELVWGNMRANYLCRKVCVRKVILSVFVRSLFPQLHFCLCFKDFLHLIP